MDGLSLDIIIGLKNCNCSLIDNQYKKCTVVLNFLPNDQCVPAPATGQRLWEAKLAAIALISQKRWLMTAVLLIMRDRPSADYNFKSNVSCQRGTERCVHCLNLVRRCGSIEDDLASAKSAPNRYQLPWKAIDFGAF